MHEELAKSYVDRLLQEGFRIYVTGNDAIVIVDPVDAEDFLDVRDPQRGASPEVRKDAIVSYLTYLSKIT